jgi:hypothetical protein
MFSFFSAEYCEGFLEIINTVEERIELESRLKVYEEMYANMIGEMERLKNNETKLNNQVKIIQKLRHKLKFTKSV